MKFDKTIHKEFNGETVDCWFVFGNEKVVFIKGELAGQFCPIECAII